MIQKAEKVGIVICNPDRYYLQYLPERQLTGIIEADIPKGVLPRNVAIAAIQEQTDVDLSCAGLWWVEKLDVEDSDQIEPVTVHFYRLALNSLKGISYRLGDTIELKYGDEILQAEQSLTPAAKAILIEENKKEEDDGIIHNEPAQRNDFSAGWRAIQGH